jgi:hypothetical protein
VKAAIQLFFGKSVLITRNEYFPGFHNKNLNKFKFISSKLKVLMSRFKTRDMASLISRV